MHCFIFTVIHKIRFAEKNPHSGFLLKWIIHQKMEMLSIIIHPCVITNLLMQNTKYIFMNQELTTFLLFFFEEKKKRFPPIIIFSFYEKNKYIKKYRFGNDIRVNK